MDKRAIKRKFRDAMAHSPLFVRRFLTDQKLKKMCSYLMSESDIQKGLTLSVEGRDSLVSSYMEKNPKEAQRFINEMNMFINANPLYRNKDNLEIVKKDMLWCRFAYGFQPDEYIMYGFGGGVEEHIRQQYVSDTERLCFRFCVNDFSQAIFTDKADTYKVLSKYYKRDAVIIENKGNKDAFMSFVEKHPEFVQKLVASSRGEGVKLVRLEGSIQFENYFQEILKFGKVLLEERIVQDDIMAQFNFSSVNTVRVSTMFTRNGIDPSFGFFRTGRNGSFVDNAATGGVFATIDTYRGIISSDGCDEFGYTYSEHPESGVRFKNFALPEWEKALKLCKEAALLFPDIKYISWDLAYSNKEWCIVEVNPSGQFVHQAASRKGYKVELERLMNEMDLMLPITIGCKPYRGNKNHSYYAH